MPELFEAYRNARSNEDFKNLSYREQKRVERGVLQSDLERLQKQGHSIEELEPAYETLMNAPPKFENEEYGRILKEKVEHFKKTGEGFADLQTLLMQQGSTRNGIVRSFVMKNIADPLFSDDKLYTNYDFLTGSDADKFVAYFSHAAEQRQEREDVDQEYTRWLKATNTLSGIHGVIEDMAAFRSPIPAGRALARATGGGIKALARNIPRSKRLAHWSIKHLLPEGGEAGLEGTLGVFREDLLRKQQGKEGLQGFGAIAKTFGLWAAEDLIIGSALSTVAPFLGSATRSIFRKGSEARKVYSEEGFQGLLQMVKKGEAPEEYRHLMDDYSLDRDYQRAVIDDLKGYQDDMNLKPELKTHVQAMSNGMTFRPLDDGTYRIFYNDPKTKGLKKQVLNNFDEAKTEMGRVAYRRFKQMGEEAQTDYLQNPLNRELVTIGRVSDDIDTSLGKGAKKKGRKSSMAERKVITRAEADDFQKKHPGSVYEIELGDGKKGLQVVTSPAPVEDVMRANRLAREAGRKSGESFSIEQERDLTRTILKEQGFDAMQPPGGGRFETLFDNQVKEIGVVEEAKPAKTKEFNKIDQKGFIERKIRASVDPETVASNPNLTVKTAISLSNEPSLEKAKRFSKVYLEGKGVKGKKVKTSFLDKEDLEEGTFAFVKSSGDEVEVSIPRRITEAKEQKAFISQLLEEFDNLAKREGTDVGKVRTAKQWRDVYYRSEDRFTVPLGAQGQKQWISSVAADLGGRVKKVEDGFELKLRNMDEPEHFKTLDDLIDGLAFKTIDYSSAQMELAKKGYKLSQGKEGQFLVRGKGTEVKGSSLEETLRKVGHTPEKISNRYAPQVALIDNNQVEVSITGKTSVGSRKKLLQLLDSFEDKDELERMTKVVSKKSGEIFYRPEGNYRLFMPELGIVEDFSSKAKARMFLETGWKKYRSLVNQGRKKGLEVFAENGNYKIATPEGEILTATGLEDVKRVFRSYPDPDGAQEIVDYGDLDAELRKEMDLLGAHELPRSTNKVPFDAERVTNPEPIQKASLRTAAGMYLKRVDKFFHDVADEYDHPDLIKNYQQMENGRKIAQSQSNKLKNWVTNYIFKPKGKLIEKERRRAVFYLGGAQTQEEMKGYLEQFGKLSEDEKVAVQRMGELYDALAKNFDIDARKLVHNYMSRIRNYYYKVDRDVINDQTFSEDLFTAEFGKEKVPEDLKKVFFEEDRVMDVLSIAVDDDAMSVMMKYIDKGFKKKYIGGPWRNMARWMNNTEGLPREVKNELIRYKDKLMGTFLTTGEEKLMEFGEAFMRKTYEVRNKYRARKGLEPIDIKKETVDAGRNFMRTAFSLNYLTNLGFRPWLAMRNCFQVFTTLSMYYPTDEIVESIRWVDDALKKGGQELDDLHDRLVELGVLSRRPPVVGEVAGMDSLVGKATQKGLRIFTNSDEYTRTIAYLTATRALKRGMDKAQRGVLRGKEDFLFESHLSRTPDEIKENVWNLVQSGDDTSMRTADSIYGSWASEQTMFSYRPSDNPRTRDGIIGKLFGQYGTFPLGYRSVIGNGLKYGSRGEKIGGMARFIGNQLAIFGALSAVGIEADEFIPFTPAVFTGGPLFELGISAIDATDINTYRGKQARAKLMRSLPQLVPGSLHYRYLRKAIEYADKGDAVKAIMSLTTTPVK